MKGKENVEVWILSLTPKKKKYSYITDVDLQSLNSDITNPAVGPAERLH